MRDDVSLKFNKIDCNSWNSFSKPEKLELLKTTFSNKLSNIIFNSTICGYNPEGLEELESLREKMVDYDSLKEKLTDYDNMKEQVNKLEDLKKQQAKYETVIQQMQSTIEKQNEYIKSIKG